MDWDRGMSYNDFAEEYSIYGTQMTKICDKPMQGSYL
jgi:hypothetical protein